MVAAHSGTPACMQIILLTGVVDINAANATGRTALHYACRAGKRENILFLLSQPNINFEARTCGGLTPLMCVAESGDIHSVAECLNRGLNPF